MSVVSDGSWGSMQSPVLMDDMFSGETYNASLESSAFDAGAELQLVNASTNSTGLGAPYADVTIFSSFMLPPVSVVGSVPAVDFWQVQDGPTKGQWVFDFGQNQAGYTTINLPKGLCAQAGELTVRQQFAEALHSEKGPVFHHFDQSKEQATLYCNAAAPGDSTGLEYTVHFSQMGFRYVQLSLQASHNSSIASFRPTKDMLTARFISTGFEQTSTFACSNSVISGSQHMILASARSNWMSIPTDCPTRERAGWLGDAHIAAETILRNFNAYGGYRLFLHQIEESLNAEGNPPDVVPFLGGYGGGGTPTWAAAFPFIADWLVWYYDDAQLMSEFYSGVQRYMEYQINRTKDGKCFGAPDWGDWCPPGPAANVSSNCAGGSKQVSCFHYLTGLRIIARWASALSKSADSKRYTLLVSTVEADFKTGYKSGEGYGSQTFNSLGMELGLHNGAELDVLTNATAHDVMVKHGGHLNTGIIGTKYLLKALGNNHRADVALSITTTTAYPGWGWWLSQGATSLWENWQGTRYLPGGSGKNNGTSWNHVMFSSNGQFFYEHVGGVRLPSPTAPDLPLQRAGGWQYIIVDPSVLHSPAGTAVCTSVSWANVTSRTARGTIQFAWRCMNSTSGHSDSDSDTTEEGTSSGSGAGSNNRTRSRFYSPSLHYDLTVPVGTTAEVRMPSAFGDTIMDVENEQLLWSASSAPAALEGAADTLQAPPDETSDGAVRLLLGSGRYQLRMGWAATAGGDAGQIAE